MSAAGSPESRALVRRIQDVRFTTARVRVSYDMNDVDEVLDRLVDTIDAGQDPRPIAVTAEFGTVRWREGYTMKEVDSFLDAILLDPAIVPAGGVPVDLSAPTPAGGRAAQRPPEEMPAAPRATRAASRAAAPPAGGSAPTSSGSTRRGGRTVGGMLLDHIEEVGKPMPQGEDGSLVLAAAERLDAATATPGDVIAIALEVADLVLLAAAVAEHYGFTVEEAVREKTREELAG